MSRYVIHSTGNVIVADESFMELHYSEDYALLDSDSTPETHLKSFTTTQLHESFTSVEAIAALSSTNPIVKAQAELLAMKRNKPMTKNDPGYISAITDLLNEGIFDSDTYDSYLQGVPLDRL